MTLAVALYTAALALPMPARSSETGAARAERMATIALAIDAETADADAWRDGWTRADWAWAAFAKAWHESGRFDLRVHDGRVRGSLGERCLGQIMVATDAIVGTDYDSTRACVRESLRILRLHAARCRVGAAGVAAVTRVYSGYGTGGSCSATARWSSRRAWMWARLRAQHGPRH